MQPLPAVLRLVLQQTSKPNLVALIVQKVSPTQPRRFNCSYEWPRGAQRSFAGLEQAGLRLAAHCSGVPTLSRPTHALSSRDGKPRHFMQS